MLLFYRLGIITENELSFCYNFSHKNIIKVLDYGYILVKDVKCPFYVMPYYSQTLRTLIDNGINVDSVLRYFSLIIDGIEAAHLMKIYHRDIKPENILYNKENDSLVIADFGIAHFNEDILATDIETKPNSKLANIRYSSPEQRIVGAVVNYKSDIFSLGLILNEMFTKEVPHGSGYKKISDVAQNYSYLDSIIDKMIQQNSSARYSSIEEIKKELIGRKNEFVALQKLNEKKQEVIPALVIPEIHEVKINDIDYINGNLIINLNIIPDSIWIALFKNPREGYSSLVGYGPEAFNFRGKTVSIGISEGYIQQIIDSFKQYIGMATRAYQHHLSTEAKKKENENKLRLQNEIEDAEKRKRVLEKVKF